MVLRDQVQRALLKRVQEHCVSLSCIYLWLFGIQKKKNLHYLEMRLKGSLRFFSHFKLNVSSAF